MMQSSKFKIQSSKFKVGELQNGVSFNYLNESRVSSPGYHLPATNCELKALTLNFEL